MDQFKPLIFSIIRPRIFAALQVGIDQEELWAIAELAKCEALATWDQEKGSSISTWVYLHVRREIEKVISREIHRQNLPCVDMTPQIFAEHRAILRQTILSLQAKLDPSDYRVLYLVHVLGFSIQEAADLYDLTPEALRKKLQRARKKAVTFLSISG